MIKNEFHIEYKVKTADGNVVERINKVRSSTESRAYELLAGAVELKQKRAIKIGSSYYIASEPIIIRKYWKETEYIAVHI